MWTDNTLEISDLTTIENFLAFRSKSMTEYVKRNENKSTFTLWYKSLTHSDLPTRGKRTSNMDGFEKNLLYYLSVNDMNELQKQFPEKKFECAKQSNIGMPNDFYQDLGVPRIQRRKGQQSENHKWISINDYMPVYLVNDTMTYFNMYYTKQILNKLDKEIPTRWPKDEINFDKQNWLTEIDLHEAIHGLGIVSDDIFHNLRLTMFLNDTIIFLIEHNKNKPNLFILLEKNVMFFTLLGLKDTLWANEERIRRYQERMMIKEGLTIEPPEQIYDNEWDNILLP